MKIIIPHNCPSCDSLLETVKGQLFCRNKACSAQSSKTVENFCKKMKIKGFGAKTIDKLELQTISDLYNLNSYELHSAVGVTVGNKLMNEIELSCTCEFSQFLGSLGIPLIGTVAAQKIATKCNSLNGITQPICKDSGLGDKATESLLNFFASEQGEEITDTVNEQFTFDEVKPKATSKVNLAIDVCITGKLEDFPSRTKAADYLEQYGISVKKSVTKTVQYLICEDDSKVGSSSYKKAESNGIQIITIKNLINSLENK